MPTRNFLIQSRFQTQKQTQKSNSARYSSRLTLVRPFFWNVKTEHRPWQPQDMKS